MKKEGLVQNLARSPHRLAALWFAVLAVALANCSQAPAQNVVTLVEYTNGWRYLDTGADPGSDWATTNYNDSAWPAGPGPLGVEPGVPYQYPLRIGTPLALGSPSTPAHYFRTQFHFDATNFGPALQLRAELFVDDGCVVFLNGTEAGRLRVPAGQTFITFASDFQHSEGTNEVMMLNPALLLTGTNTIAVEVHNLQATSSDIFLGLRLRTERLAPVTFLRQPAGFTGQVGKSGALSVETTGGGVTHQWFRNGQPLANATNATLPLSPLQTNQAGLYWVVASNALGTAQSDSALVNVSPDVRGPRVITGYLTSFGTSMRIILGFDELLLLASANQKTNYQVTKVETQSSEAPGMLIYSGVNVVLQGFSSGFLAPGFTYLVTINRVRDPSPATNIIAPDSQIIVSWPATNFFVGTNATWHYHASLLDNPSAAEAHWFDPNFQENTFWQQGPAPFYGSLNSGSATGIFTVVPYQAHRTLFRVPFLWPSNAPASNTLDFVISADSGVVLYLNGNELSRDNVPAVPAILDVNTRAYSGTVASMARSVIVTNLLPGQTNWLTAAVHQRASVSAMISDDDTNFFFQVTMKAGYPVSTPVPALPAPPILNLTRLNSSQAQLSWTGPGFALEGTTNSANPQPGPWFEVPNMANPFVLDLNQPYRLFRLRK